MTTTPGAASRRAAGRVRAGELLGLGGRVDDEGFMALMEGRDPGTGERLRAGGRAVEGGGV